VTQNIEGVLQQLADELRHGGEVPLPDPPPQAGEGAIETAS
jgi:hypothetical protein